MKTINLPFSAISIVLALVISQSLSLDYNYQYDYDDLDDFDAAELARQREAGMSAMNNAENQPEIATAFIPQLVTILTKKLVSVQVESLRESDSCPSDFTAQMCQQLRQKGSFYIWLHKLREEAIAKMGMFRNIKKKLRWMFFLFLFF